MIDFLIMWSVFLIILGLATFLFGPFGYFVAFVLCLLGVIVYND